MYCTKCGYDATKVLDSRITENGKSTRRRRECKNCGHRFTTYETIEAFQIIVEKSGNRKEKYEREKLEDSIVKATNKRKISMQEIHFLLDRLEAEWSVQHEITSKQIGKEILLELKQLDTVAYIRYASVHLDFDTPKDFIDFIQDNINI